MKPFAILAGGALLAASFTASAVGQTTSPLAYVQPVPPTAVQAVQEHLRSAGAYNGAADGVWGPDSVAAISAMGTTCPTARAAHAFAHFIKANSYASASGFILFGGCNPTDPFIARQRRNVLPRLQRFYVGGQCLFQVRGQVMDHAARDLFCAQSFAHKFMARVASACHSCSFEWSYLSQQGKVAQARKDSGDR